MDLDKMLEPYEPSEYQRDLFASVKFQVDVNDRLLAKFSGDVKSVDDRNLIIMSIWKWEFVLKYMRESRCVISDEGMHTCALCQVYYGRMCKGCPIAHHTGDQYCGGTPYDDFVAAKTLGEHIVHAEDELEFLKDLLSEVSCGFKD